MFKYRAVTHSVYAWEMSRYYSYHDTEALAAELFDINDANTLVLHDLIAAGAPKNQIITTAMAIDEELVDWLCSEIPW